MLQGEGTTAVIVRALAVNMPLNDNVPSMDSKKSSMHHSDKKIKRVCIIMEEQTRLCTITGRPAEAQPLVCRVLRSTGYVITTFTITV